VQVVVAINVVIINEFLVQLLLGFDVLCHVDIFNNVFDNF
jgi:hypothetical protein